ncbi:DUF2157 domain-containing protein [Bacillus sp. M6-12]|uniref:DUF2157 domain-containing protein n=1 Tax=Bacillus sp. M6-12 TaxID=2054166 RepID=UPI0021556AFB|nr:DUF2157 domain-containing protein [Bacillus sp. M6-12]
MKNELEFFERKGLLPDLQKEEILGQYEVSGGLNFVRILLTVGAFLLGIGVLSFVASNWIYMGKTLKFALILLSILGVNIAGLKMAKNHPKTALTMHYLGVLFFGAGIFLVEQMFNIGGEYQNSLLIWALGSIPIAYVLKDKIILIFISFLLFFYQTAIFIDDDFGLHIPYSMLLMIPLLCFINKQINYSKLFTFFVNALAIEFVTLLVFRFVAFDEERAIFGLLFLFFIGIAMVFIPVKDRIKTIFEVQGHLIHGFVGIALTFSFLWEESIFGSHFHFIFGVAYFLFVLFLMKRGSLFSIVILCALILRFYVDLSYDFLPKSMVFILGGAILMGFGYYFEKQRKKGGKKNVG